MGEQQLNNRNFSPNLLKNEDLDKAINNINNAIEDSSEIFSTRCRYIVTSFLVFVWGLLFERTIVIEWHVVVLVVFLLVYFLIDLLQYLFILLAYRKHNKELNKLMKGISSFDDIKDAENNDRERINNVSFYFFITKSILLIPIFIGFFMFIIQILKKDIV